MQNRTALHIATLIVRAAGRDPSALHLAAAAFSADDLTVAAQVLQELSSEPELDHLGGDARAPWPVSLATETEAEHHQEDASA
ncbi:MAG TPA: hypothetical protein VMY40_14955 [Anaerolineae bacterium]|nr:hypothetical protein [Anaerolineae bacterium]